MTQLLHPLLRQVGLEPPEQLANAVVTSISCDSRRQGRGSVFVGLEGTQVDGGRFWRQALQAGASAALISEVAAAADPPGPTDYLSEVRSVVPETPSIDVAIVGGDSFFELGVDPGVEAIVLGYQGERYVWFRAGGAVFENQNSPAAYLNASRYGDQEVPASVSADAPPDWTQVATGGRLPCRTSASGTKASPVPAMLPRPAACPSASSPDPPLGR